MTDSSEYLNKEIEKARRLYQLFGPACRHDATICSLTEKYLELIRRTDSLMHESGVVDACTRCAESKGSCCFREMGESYGFQQLLTNLLLGVPLPEQADFPETCHFIGEKGCKLKAKHSFCLNYFCPELKELLGKEMIGKLERIVGEQLWAGWELELLLDKLSSSDTMVRSK